MRALTAVPPNQTGIYIYSHKHLWVELGATKEPAGWYPVFGCTECPDMAMGDYIEPATP